ncbi:MAG: sigma-70 family RNA polymerase sigma factor [Oscillospiraceae bacterium]|nr:sigma-70 family RNA polymerase sigma factor [Oscillospiraceae bacterium]
MNECVNDMDHDDIISASTDEELVRRFRDGTASGRVILTELVSRYFGFLKSRTLELCPDSSAFEDLLHEGILGFITAVRRYDESKGRFFPFAYSCVSNRITDALRRRSDTVYLAEDEEDGSLSPEAAFINRELAADALAALSPLEYEVLLHRISGHSFDETAQALNVSKRSAENAAVRARQKLRRQFPSE